MFCDIPDPIPVTSSAVAYASAIYGVYISEMRAFIDAFQRMRTSNYIKCCYIKI